MTLRADVLKAPAFVLITCLLATTSCKEDDPDRITLQDSADLTDEAVTEAYFQDLDDMAGLAIQSPTEMQYSSGRVFTTITIEDHRFDCDGITVTVTPDANSEPAMPKGVITIDFGASGCQDLKGNTRKGKLIFTYNGKRFMPGATVVTTTENYFINDVKLEGVRTLTNLQNSTEEAPRFNAVLQNGKATFPNGLFATRQSDITWQWIRADNPLNDYLLIEATSEASGITRAGREYHVDVVEALTYKRHCGVAVSGVKQYTIGEDREVTIDYGDGACDRSFTVTVDGFTRDINL